MQCLNLDLLPATGSVILAAPLKIHLVEDAACPCPGPAGRCHLRAAPVSEQYSHRHRCGGGIGAIAKCSSAAIA
jgi:hypothetical protein